MGSWKKTFNTIWKNNSSENPCNTQDSSPTYYFTWPYSLELLQRIDKEFLLFEKEILLEWVKLCVVSYIKMEEYAES